MNWIKKVPKIIGFVGIVIGLVIGVRQLYLNFWHNPHEATRHVEIGNEWLNVGVFEEARKEFNEAIELDKSNSRAQLGAMETELSLSIRTAKDFDPAIVAQKLYRLKEEYPDDTHIETLKGDLLSIRDPYNVNVQHPLVKAINHYKTAVDLDSENALAYFRMGVVYYQLGEKDKYVEEMSEAAKAATKATHLDFQLFRSNYASALAHVKHYREAIEQYKRVKDEDPSYLRTYAGMAWVYRLMGNLRTADKYQRYYIDLLNNKEITSLPRNQRALSGVSRTGPGKSDLVWTSADIESHQYYAYYDEALTSYLLGNTEEAVHYVDKAKSLGIDDSTESELKKALSYEFVELRKEREDFAPKIDEFRSKFL